MINSNYPIRFSSTFPRPETGEAKELEVLLLSLIRRLVTSLHLPCLPVVILGFHPLDVALLFLIVTVNLQLNP